MSDIPTQHPQQSNTKFYIAIGILLAIMMVFIVIFSPSVLSLLVKTNQDANQTNIETKNQTKILVDFISAAEKNRSKNNMNIQKLLANQETQLNLLQQGLDKQDYQIKLLVNESRLKIALLNNITEYEKQVRQAIDLQKAVLDGINNITTTQSNLSNDIFNDLQKFGTGNKQIGLNNYEINKYNYKMLQNLTNNFDRFLDYLAQIMEKLEK